MHFSSLTSSRVHHGERQIISTSIQTRFLITRYPHALFRFLLVIHIPFP